MNPPAPETRGVQREFPIKILGAIGTILLAATAVLLTEAAPDRGTLEVRITDHREAIEDFQSLIVTIVSVGVHPQGKPRREGWVDLAPERAVLDLAQYVAGREGTVVRSEVAAGAYDAIWLRLAGILGVRKAADQAPVKFESGPVAVVFRVSPERPTVLRLDLVVMDLSDHPGKGYELHVKDVSVRTGE